MAPTKQSAHLRFLISIPTGAGVSIDMVIWTIRDHSEADPLSGTQWCTVSLSSMRLRVRERMRETIGNALVKIGIGTYHRKS
jgi:hypothetical protein